MHTNKIEPNGFSSLFLHVSLSSEFDIGVSALIRVTKEKRAKMASNAESANMLDRVMKTGTHRALVLVHGEYIYILLYISCLYMYMCV